MSPYRPSTLTRLTGLAALVLSFAGAEAVLAQTHSVEITPNFGYRWGGRILDEDNPALDFDANLRDDISFGLTINLPVSKHVQIELLADRQSTGLRREALFTPSEPGFELDVAYYQIGVLGQWPTGRVTPFVVGGIGVVDLRPDVAGLSSSRRLSSSLGGGIKIGLSENVGIRLEARGFWSDTSGSRWDWDDDCGRDRCYWERERDLVQTQVKVGVIFQF